MRVDILHRRMMEDVSEMVPAVATILPVEMPVRYQTRAMNLTSFLKRLNAATEPLGLYHEMKADKEVKEGEVKIEGLWVPKCDLPENGSSADLRLIWHIHPSTRRLGITAREWARRRFVFWQMYTHELVHRWQDAYRKTPEPRVYRPHSTERDEKQLQLYYGNYDEIEAYAHDTAVELLLWWKHLPFREALNTSLDYPGVVVAPTYRFYASAFPAGHPALKRYVRKTRSWYDVLLRADDLGPLELPNLVT